uniref:Uncharacterized protein n=1 Tax=Lepeophtheirus salmonis TaxID=72036 RepID=A0A0K2TK14_LEPSM
MWPLGFFKKKKMFIWRKDWAISVICVGTSSGWRNTLFLGKPNLTDGINLDQKWMVMSAAGIL